jgi:uncharacterized membrane protein (DUF106 family)
MWGKRIEQDKNGMRKYVWKMMVRSMGQPFIFILFYFILFFSPLRFIIPNVPISRDFVFAFTRDTICTHAQFDSCFVPLWQHVKNLISF